MLAWQSLGVSTNKHGWFMWKEVFVLHLKILTVWASLAITSFFRCLAKTARSLAHNSSKQRDKGNNKNNNKSAQSNLARGPWRGAVAHICPIGPCGQWCTPNSPPNVPLPVDRYPNPTTRLIHGPVRPMMPNGIRIQSTVFPQCTGQTDGQTDRPTNRSFTEKSEDYRPLHYESDVA